MSAPKSFAALFSVMLLAPAVISSLPSTAIAPVCVTAPPETSVRLSASADANFVAPVLRRVTSCLTPGVASVAETVMLPPMVLPALLAVMSPPTAARVASCPACATPEMVMPPLPAVAERLPLVAFTLAPMFTLPAVAARVTSFCAWRLPEPFTSPAAAVTFSDPLVSTSASSSTSPDVSAEILSALAPVVIAPSVLTPFSPFNVTAPFPVTLILPVEPTESLFAAVTVFAALPTFSTVPFIVTSFSASIARLLLATCETSPPAATVTSPTATVPALPSMSMAPRDVVTVPLIVTSPPVSVTSRNASTVLPALTARLSSATSVIEPSPDTSPSATSAFLAVTLTWPLLLVDWTSPSMMLLAVTSMLPSAVIASGPVTSLALLARSILPLFSAVIEDAAASVILSVPVTFPCAVSASELALRSPMTMALSLLSVTSPTWFAATSFSTLPILLLSPLRSKFFRFVPSLASLRLSAVMTPAAA